MTSGPSTRRPSHPASARHRLHRAVYLRPTPPAARRRGLRTNAGEIVAHELRTPLTTVLLGSRILLRGDIRGQPRGDVVLDLATEAQRLADAVEDLLLVAGLADEPGPPEPIRLQQVARLEVDRALGLAPDVRFRFLLPADVPPVLADEGRASHLLRNLVADAVEEAGPLGFVEVSVVGTATGGVRVRVGGQDRQRRQGGAPRPEHDLRQAATRMLADRLGGRLGYSTTPHGIVAQLVLPGVDEASILDEPVPEATTP